jgi:hypothetical protein
MVPEPYLDLLTVKPFTRFNEMWRIADPALKNLLSEFDSSKQYSTFEDTYSIEFADPELHQRAFLHVVTETIFDYPHNANGEKTVKPIACFRPFVLVCVPGALQELRDLGFKTFSNWWDESYDLMQDPTKRLYAVLNIVKYICSLEIADLKNMLDQMQPVLEHNYFHYYNVLREDQLKKFEQACCENLKPR